MRSSAVVRLLLVAATLPSFLTGQFVQQGSKLVGTGAIGPADQGQSVAVSSDGTTLIVGGFLDDANGSPTLGRGAAWVYVKSGANWVQQGPKLVDPTSIPLSEQGYSVALSADGNTALVGSPSAVVGFTVGAARVWVRSAGVWTQQATLVGTGAAGVGTEGYSVALSADGDTAIIGGVESISGNSQFGVGAAWVFTRSGGVWTQQGSKLVGSGAVGNSGQGSSVALSADGNTALVAGVNDNNQTGAVWVWTRSGGVWTQQGPKLTGVVGFGNSVSLSSDGNTAAVGTTSFNGGVGDVTIFVRSGGVWSQQGAVLTGSGATGHSRQGTSVSLSGDGNVLLSGGNSDSAGAGGTWVWTRVAGMWTQQPGFLKGSGEVGAAGEGTSVALSTDSTTAVIGGPFDNGSAGAAWVFVAPLLAPVITTQPLSLVCPGAQATFTAAASGSLVPVVQWQVSVANGPFTDIPGATSTTLTIQVAPALSGNQYRAVFTNDNGSATTNPATLSAALPVITLDPVSQTVLLGQTATFTVAGTGDPTPTIQWRDGITFAPIPGATSNTLSVLATQATDGSKYFAAFTNACGTTNTQTAQLRVAAPPAITLQPSSQTICAGANTGFVQQNAKLVGTGVAGGAAEQGSSVALSADGNTAIVGGPADNAGVGAAWIYTRSGDAWVQQGPKLVGTGAVGPSTQGYSVAISGDGNTAVIGGPGDNGNTGAVWIFTRTGGVWTQQGQKLVGTGVVAQFGHAFQGVAVALAQDGTTLLEWGPLDSGVGAGWVFTRSGGVWTQQGAKLVRTGVVNQGNGFASVALSADGNTAIIGNTGDNGLIGAAWVFTRTGGVWTQQGNKLVGSGAVGTSEQGAVGLSADGNTAVIGGFGDNLHKGAMWVFTRTGGVWTQQGNKLVGTGAVGAFTPDEGSSVAISADGSKAAMGGPGDNLNIGATWLFNRTGGVWTQQGNKLVGSGADGGSQQGSFLGLALSADGSTLLVGGRFDGDTGIDWMGAAWVFATNAASPAGFTAAASGAPAPTVQWQVSTDGGATFTDIPNATLPTLSVSSTPASDGHVYRALFTNATGTATTQKVTLTVNTAPVVTLAPTNQLVAPGGNAVFTAAATGKPTPTVQWQVSTDGGMTFVDLAGATSTTLSFAATQAMDGNQYRAVFTDSCAIASSTAAALTVNGQSAPARVTLNPVNQTVCAGMMVSFTAAATGVPTPTVQWQVSTDGGATFSNIPGATAATLSFSATAGQNGNRYLAVFSNGGGSANSTAAVLSVNTAPVVTVNALPLSLNVGDTAVFTAAAIGNPAPTVQWQVSTDGGVTFNDIPGATSTTLSFVVAQAMDGNRYTAVFTNICGQVATDPPVLLAVNAVAVVGPETSFQVGYASNLNIGDSVINFTNTGTLTLPSGLTTTGNLCVNTYTFDASEEMVSCCSCLVTPNGLNSLSAKTDLISNNLTPGVPTSIVFKMVASIPLGLNADGSGGSCNASAPTALTLAPGLSAWSTTLHALPTNPVSYGLTENPLSTSPLSAAELRKLTLFCGLIQANGSGFGICKSCRTGGLGASAQ